MFLLLSFLAASALCQDRRKNSVTSIEDFKGMAGCWEHKDKAKRLLISEQWMKPAGTSILGIGRTVKNGKTVGFEYMRIEQNADGIFFISRPSENKEETAFKLKSRTLNSVVFENPEHDFPQRVIYKLFGTKMVGRIEGNNDGKFVGMDFPMVKASCS